MSFLVPKQVEIANLKLRVLYYFITFFALVLAVAKFIVTEQWASQRPVGPHIAAELWLNPTDLTRFRDVWDAKSASWFCETPSLTDYQWDPAGRWTYENHVCRPPCDLLGGVASSPCIHPMDTYRRESQSQLFFVTHIEERAVGAHGEDAMAFVPLEDAHTVAIAYHFAVPQPTDWGGVADRGRQLDVVGGSAGNFDSDVLTVIQGADRAVSRVVEPGAPTIEFDMRDLLALAGLSNFLESPNPRVGPNFIAGHQSPEDGAIGRLTGVNVDLNLQCLQRQDPTVSLEGHAGQDWTGKVCYLRVEQSPSKNWASVEESEMHGAGGVKRTYHGIRLAVVPGGVFKFLDFEVLVLQITSSIVLLMMPKHMMFFFIVHMLGHLSVIYRDAIIERFSVGREIACITARILSTSVTFLELETDDPTQSPRAPDRDPMEQQILTKEGWISRGTMGTQMQEVLRSRKAMLQEDEMTALIEFCFQSIQDIAKLSHKQSIRDDMHEMRLIKGGTAASLPGRADAGKVNIDSFSTCCASSPSMEFDSFVKLFDMSRRTGFCERWFTPTYFAEMVQFFRGHGSDQVMDEAGPDGLGSDGTGSAGTGSDGTHKKAQASLRAKKAEIVKAASQVVVNKNVVQQNSDIINKNVARMESLELKSQQREKELESDLTTRLDGLKHELQDRLVDLQASVEKTSQALQSASAASAAKPPPEETLRLEASAEAAFADVDAIKTSVAALARRLEAVEHIALLAAEATQGIAPQGAPQGAPRGGPQSRAVDQSQVNVQFSEGQGTPQLHMTPQHEFSAAGHPGSKEDVNFAAANNGRAWRSPCSFSRPALTGPR